MNATEVKPSLNGVIKLSRRGLVKFQFEDDQPVFAVDVLAVYDAWHEVNWQLRILDEQGMGIVPNDKQDEFGQNRLNFVQATVNDAYARLEMPVAAPQLTRAEAEAFIEEITKKAAELRNFTYGKKDTPSLPQESTDNQRINFSQ